MYVFLESTVFLFPFVVDCGLVTRNRESCYRLTEYLMQLRDEHNAQLHSTDGESGGEEKRVSNLVTFFGLFASTRIYSLLKRQCFFSQTL